LAANAGTDSTGAAISGGDSTMSTPKMNSAPDAATAGAPRSAAQLTERAKDLATRRAIARRLVASTAIDLRASATFVYRQHIAASSHHKI
jgi:hypothetical protein